VNGSPARGSPPAPDLEARRRRVRWVRKLVKRGWTRAACRATDFFFAEARVACAVERSESGRVVHVLDPWLFDGVGHYLNLNAAVRDAVDAQPGWRAGFYGRLDLDASVRAALPARPFFVKGASWSESSTSEESDYRAGPSKQSRAVDHWPEFNLRRLSALSATVIRPGDAVLVHTLNAQSFPSTLAKWMRGLAPERLPIFVIYFMLPDYILRDSDSLHPDYVELFSALRTLPRDRMILVAETREMRDDLMRRTGGDVPIGIAPHLKPASVLEVARSLRTQRPPGDLPRIGYAGHARRDRGAHLVPEVLKLLESQRIEARFRVHVQNRVWSAVDLPLLESLRDIDLRTGSLDLDAYYRFVAGIDIMLLPFELGLRTELQGSGVFWECLSLAQVMVLPRPSHFEREARRVGAGFTTFQDREPVAIAKAAREAVEHFPELSAQSRRAAADWFEERNASRFFAGVLGAGSPEVDAS